MATIEEKKDYKAEHERQAFAALQPEQSVEAEQSTSSHLVEHHLKIQQLERKVAFLQGEIDGMEARRRERQKTAMIMIAAFCYGMAIALLFDL